MSTARMSTVPARTLWLRLRSAWVTLTGMGAAASVAFGLLVFVAVLASLVIPRESAALRTGALQRVIAVSHPVDRTVAATVGAPSMKNGVSPFPAADLTAIGTALRARLAADGVPVASNPPSWTSLTTGYVPFTGATRSASYGPPQLEVTYRSALGPYSHLVAGRLPAGGSTASGSTAGGRAVVQGAVTTATAGRFGLRVGTRLTAGPLQLVVTGIIRPARPASAFWHQPTVAAQPLLVPASPTHRPYWIGAFFIGPGALPLIEQQLAVDEMQATWVYPLVPGALLPLSSMLR